jgi:NAD(P)-dependent dehydrogenase (short-subunit alcohol dehydrogenase family)
LPRSWVCAAAATRCPIPPPKSGIVNFTRALACDLARDGIRVNAIASGFNDIRMALLPNGSGHEHQTGWFKEVYLKHGCLPLGRPGLPADIAGPAVFLCSENSRYVTGQILLVDGGVSATFERANMNESSASDPAAGAAG